MPELQLAPGRHSLVKTVSRVLSQAQFLSPAAMRRLNAQLWRHALAAIAEAVLAGFAGVTGRCTPMGRAAMSLDLQQVSK